MFFSKLSCYVHNIDVFEGGGFACPHDKGKKSASEFKLDSNASCLTFLDIFGVILGAKFVHKSYHFLGGFKKAPVGPPPEDGGAIVGPGCLPRIPFHGILRQNTGTGDWMLRL